MAIEIERKWLAPAVPSERLVGPPARLRQGYVALDGPVAVRVRISDEAIATVTIKGAGGLSRVEVESTVPLADGEQLWELTGSRRIAKRRYRVEVATDAVADVDVYDDALDGLCTVEVEFDSTDAADAFVAPAWFGLEVTGDVRWTNASLALDGRPGA